MPEDATLDVPVHTKEQMERVGIGWRLRCAHLYLWAVWQLFTAVDKNGDGTLTKAELIKAIKTFRDEDLALLGFTTTSSTAQVVEFVSTLDRDGDKKISKAEWLEHFQLVEPAAEAEAPTGTIESSPNDSSALVVVPGTKKSGGGLKRTATFSVSQNTIEELSKVCTHAAAVMGVSFWLL